MAGGFHVPSYLIETGAGGLRLIDWVRQNWGDADLPPPSAAQVKLAGWIMGAPKIRPRDLETLGIDIVDVLANRAVITAGQRLTIHHATKGEIGTFDWTKPYSISGTAISPQIGAVPDGGDAIGASSAIASPPPPVFGRLGETASGPVVRCIRGEGENSFLLSGHGVACAMNRATAVAAWAALGEALGLDAAADRAADRA